MRVQGKWWLWAITFLVLISNLCLAAPFDRERVGESSVVIERDFATVGYGQLHYRIARPKNAQAVRFHPVVCFHQTPNSSQVFIELMTKLATDRVVYALDTPGLGQSDLPRSAPEVADYAQAMAEFIQVMELESVDVIGYHTGASIAAQLAGMPETRVSHLMLVGLALFTNDEREQFFDQPWPKPIAEDGSHLLAEWQRSHQWRGAGQTDASVIRTFVEKIQAGDRAWWGARAVMRHDLQAVLKDLSVPTMVVNSRDDLFTITPRIAELRPDISLVTLDQWGFGIFEVQPKRMADLARQAFEP
ncbi:MAG: alpha/beta fold hydrolase [Lysobacterales bacterium]